MAVETGITIRPKSVIGFVTELEVVGILSEVSTVFL